MMLTLVACTPGSSTDGVARGSVRLGFPLPQRDLFTEVIGVDHDPVDHDDSPIGGAICTNFEGEHFPSCYDGHRGTDYLLDGGFETMDAGSAEIVAAATGVVISVRDGEYDRCHIGDDFDVTCDGNSGRANHVILEHIDGTQTNYWHMMKDSIVVEVGQVVPCGSMLGMVGSSGNSSTPHLHFQVERYDQRIDPYAGVESQPETWWSGQDSDDGLPEAGCAG